MYDINGDDISWMILVVVIKLVWYFLYDIGDGDYDDIGGDDLISLIWYCDADYDVIGGDDIPCIIWFI